MSIPRKPEDILALLDKIVAGDVQNHTEKVIFPRIYLLQSNIFYGIKYPSGIVSA